MSSPLKLKHLTSRLLTIPEVDNVASFIHHSSILSALMVGCARRCARHLAARQWMSNVSPPRRPQSSERQNHCAGRWGALSVRLRCWGRFLRGVMLDRILEGTQKLDKWRKGDIHRYRKRTGKTMKALNAAWFSGVAGYLKQNASIGK